MKTIADFQTIHAAARRKLAEAIVLNQTSVVPVFARESIIDVSKRIRLAEQTAKGGCFQTAFRMLQGVV